MNFITVVVCLMISRTHILLHFITVGYKKYRDTTWKSQKTFLNASFFYKTKRCHSSWYTSVTSFVPGGRSCSTSCYDTEPFAHKVYKKRDRGLGKRAVVLHGALSEWELKYRSFLQESDVTGVAVVSSNCQRYSRIVYPYLLYVCVHTAQCSVDAYGESRDGKIPTAKTMGLWRPVGWLLGVCHSLVH